MGTKLFQWYSKYKIHLVIWVLYMLYETVLVGFLFNEFGNPIIYTAHYLVFILFFYLHANYALPWGAKTGKNAFWIIILIVALEASLYLWSQFSVSYLLRVSGVAKQKLIFDYAFIIRNLYRAMLYLGFSTGYYFLITYLKERKKTEELEKERLNAIINQQRVEHELSNAQNAFLKAQINPHFLFNTLDFIYHHVNIHSAPAGEAIIRLSEMMRFAIDSEMDNDIKLGNEIEQVENLLYLQQIRKASAPQVQFTYSPETVNLKFLPLILLTLVENVFKHGEFSSPHEKAVISVAIENNFLCLKTINLINYQVIPFSNQSGLKNIERRLTYAYGDNAVFVHHINATNHFIASIRVPLELLK